VKFTFDDTPAECLQAILMLDPGVDDFEPGGWFCLKEWPVGSKVKLRHCYREQNIDSADIQLLTSLLVRSQIRDVSRVGKVELSIREVRFIFERTWFFRKRGLDKWCWLNDHIQAIYPKYLEELR
jgi:hypothetical protein